MAYDVGVRNELTKRGYSNDDIGYDENTGYVTLKGQNFMRPQKNIEGTTFTDTTSFNNALTGYDRTQKINQAQDTIIDRTLNPQQNTNPYDQQITDLISQLTTRINTPQVTNPYTTPEYAMYQAQAGQRANEGIRASQEALGSAGFGRSTTLGESAQRVQNDATQYLETQVIPMILQNQRAQQQQEISNLASLLTPLTSQQSVYDTRGQNELQNLASVLDYMTGRQDRAEDVQYRTDRDARNDFVTDRGFQFQQDQANIAQQNVEEERAYRAERDSEEDRRWLAEYEQRGQQFAESQGLQWAQLNQREKERIADEAYRRDSLGLQQAESMFNQGMQSFKETGIMPDYMSQLGINVDALNNEKTKTEVAGLYQELASGAVKPKDALARIEAADKMGLKDADVIQQLKDTVYMYDPDTRPKEAKSTATNPNISPFANKVSNLWNKFYQTEMNNGKAFLDFFIRPSGN